MRRLGRLVLEEGPELAPAGRALDQGDLANVNTAEANSHRQRDDVQALQQIVKGGRCSALVDTRIVHGSKPTLG